ncbi:MAG: response regulator [Sphingomonas sp.]
MAVLFGKRKRHLARILIVEDEPLVAFDNERFLDEEGFEVVATIDRVEDAVTLIETGTPIDLVLADVNLADGSGIDVARAAFDRGIAVLFVTGACPNHARALACGCLAKPYHQRDLVRSIDVIEAVRHGTGRPPRAPSGFSLFIELPQAG